MADDDPLFNIDVTELRENPLFDNLVDLRLYLGLNNGWALSRARLRYVNFKLMTTKPTVCVTS